MTDRLAGFGAGGDDYLTKPFHFDELVARLRALLPRGPVRTLQPTSAGCALDPVAHARASGDGEVAADADGVPAARRARGAAGRRSCAAASWCARPGRTARSSTTTRSTRTSRGCAASCAARRRAPRSRRSTASATGSDDAPASPCAARCCRGGVAGRRGSAIAALIGGFNLVLGATSTTSVQRCCARARPPQLDHGPTERRRCACASRPDDAALDALVWIFARAPRAGAAAEHPAIQRRRDGSPGGPRASTTLGGDSRLYAVAVRAGGAQVGTVVVGISLAAYEHTDGLALLASADRSACSSCSRVGVLVAGWLVGARAAAGARMTARPPTGASTTSTAASARAAARRAERARAHPRRAARPRGGGLRHEQRLSAELSHELRTPLARSSGRGRAAPRRAGRPRSARGLWRRWPHGRPVGAVLGADGGRPRRAGGGRGTRASATALARGRRLRGAPAQRAASSSSWRIAEDLRRGRRAELVERIVAPLLENAGAHGRARVVLSAAAAPGARSYSSPTTGPASARRTRERIFEPGARGAGAKARRVPGSAWPSRAAWPGRWGRRRLSYAARRAVGGRSEVPGRPAGLRSRGQVPGRC